ncbi:hypothetical protein BT93_G1787 [Corymbia citriodora subsp. variegata]|nr:hypothetical protein BT93_G1787 [Corymbia citriodora subsp. variegata]
MMKLACFWKKLEHDLPSIQKLSCLPRSCHSVASSLLRNLSRRANSFCAQLAYLVLESVIGYWALELSEPKSPYSKTRDLDLFFTSVSTSTVSSMSTVEMEAFSNSQLAIMTLPMLVGGEVFTSMLWLHLLRSGFARHNCHPVNSATFSHSDNNIELKPLPLYQINKVETFKSKLEINETPLKQVWCGDGLIKYRASKCLSYVVLIYLIVVHAGGSMLLYLYISLVTGARKVLRDKGLTVQMVSVFTTVSTFANCGFVPTNENMVAFRHNPDLLWLLLPQILLGNTLYPPCLRTVIWFLERVTGCVEFGYMLRNSREIGYAQLLPGFHCFCLAATQWGFVLVQFVALGCMEWGSQAMVGLSPYEKLVGALFEAVNTRHTDVSIFDLSIISPALLVLFVLMMLASEVRDQDSRCKASCLAIEVLDPIHNVSGPSFKISTLILGLWSLGRERGLGFCFFFTFMYLLLFLVYFFDCVFKLVIFIILICITERENLKNDPLNFNVLNIAIETVSAYGNVGYSTGYSCERRVKTDSPCRDAGYGFVGRWSNSGKFILIVVMLFGRLKKFTKKGGTAWSLS